MYTTNFYSIQNLKTTTHFFIEKTIVDKHFQILNTKNMALNNDWDDLMAPVEWEESEIDSGYFDSDNEAGNPMS